MGSPLVHPGAIFANSFEILRTIGSGGMGDVYQARRLRDGATVALKILRLELLADIEAVTRFRREGRAAAAIKSPHAARIYDVGQTEQGQPYIVMEYLEGCDLMSEIDSRGALPVAEAVSYVAQACHAMIEAHELGIVHRDLKPPNIFLALEGGRRVAKVLDFGISKISSIADGRVTSTQMSFGSPLYMSPEQIRSTKLVDQRSDVWSLGVILYEALTGEPPFMGETPGALAVVISIEPHPKASSKNPKVPPGLDEVIAGALQKDPKHRYSSASELLSALEKFLPSKADSGLSGTMRMPPALPDELPLARLPAPPQVPAAAVEALPAERARQVATLPPRSSIGPATRDRPRDRSKDRIGLIIAAIFIPLGALAFAFAIWLYAKRTSEERARQPAASGEASEPAALPPSGAAPSASAAPATPGGALSATQAPEQGASASTASASASASDAKRKKKGTPRPAPLR